MNKMELVASMSEEARLSKKDTEAALNAFIKTVSETLKKKEKIILVGFGTFESVDRFEKDGVNPRTRSPIKISARVAPKFKPGKTLKKFVNEK